MKFINRLFFREKERKEPQPYRYQQADSFQGLITKRAIEEQRPEEEIHDELLADAFAMEAALQELFKCWQSLTFREKEVMGLLRLGYTNNDIALQLNISSETVKTHVKHILHKFKLRSRQQLRMITSRMDIQ